MSSIANLVQCQNDHFQIVHQIAFLHVLSQDLVDGIVEAGQDVQQNELWKAKISKSVAIVNHEGSTIGVTEHSIRLRSSYEALNNKTITQLRSKLPFLSWFKFERFNVWLVIESGCSKQFRVSFPSRNELCSDLIDAIEFIVGNRRSRMSPVSVLSREKAHISSPMFSYW